MNNKGAKTWSLRAFPAKPASADGVTTRAKAFLAEILATEEHQFPSVGDGTDHRYRSSSPPRPISASQLSAFQLFLLGPWSVVCGRVVPWSLSGFCFLLSQFLLFGFLPSSFAPAATHDAHRSSSNLRFDQLPSRLPLLCADRARREGKKMAISLTPFRWLWLA